MRNESVSLVKSYLESIDELKALGQIYKNKLDFLHRLFEDCKEMESAYQDDKAGQQTQQIEECMTMTGRVNFAISVVQDLCAQSDQLAEDLSASLNAVSACESSNSISD